MDDERGGGEVVLKVKTSASVDRHVKFSPRVKVLSLDLGGSSGPRSEITFKEIGHGSSKSLDSSGIASLSLSGACCEDILQVNSQTLHTSVVDNNIPLRGLSGLEECRKSISKLSYVEHTHVVKDVSPTLLSPSSRVVECPMDSASPTLSGKAPREDLSFRINIGNSGSSSDHATSSGSDLNKSRQSFRFGELCELEEPSKSGKAYTRGEIHETNECRSTEHLKANGSKRGDELGRSGRISPTTKGVEANKKLDTGKKIIGSPISDVQVDTSTGDSKHKSEYGTVALPKKKKSSCRCFKWPHCSFKCVIFNGCFFCEKPKRKLKYPKWAGPCFKCLYWPCLMCQC